MSSSKPSKSTTTTWSIGRPGQRLHRRERQRRAADLVRGVDLRRAVAGDLDAEVARDREVRDPVRLRIDVEEHERVGAVRVARGPARVRRRCRSRGRSSARRGSTGRAWRAAPSRPRETCRSPRRRRSRTSGSRGRPRRARARASPTTASTTHSHQRRRRFGDPGARAGCVGGALGAREGPCPSCGRRDTAGRASLPRPCGALW